MKQFIKDLMKIPMLLGAMFIAYWAVNLVGFILTIIVIAILGVVGLSAVFGQLFTSSSKSIMEVEFKPSSSTQN